jgi:hypothetical protein
MQSTDASAHLNFAVRVEAWQHARSVSIVKELPANFEVKTAREPLEALRDALRLLYISR